MNITGSLFYMEYIAEREEVLKHKWYKSEQAGHDIGFLEAFIDWTAKHKTHWLQNRHENKNNTCNPEQ